jgi:hypothetical protein
VVSIVRNTVDDHAEALAILCFLSNMSFHIGRKGKKHKKVDVDIWVIRCKDDKLKESKPCRNCVDKMIAFNNLNMYFRIKFVHYSTKDGTIITEKVMSLDSTVTYISRGDR